MSKDLELLNGFKSTMSVKEAKLVSLLENLPHPSHDYDEVCGHIFIIGMEGRENGWTDDFICICEANPEADFSQILKLIFTEERFPPLEIVDDDEE